MINRTKKYKVPQGVEAPHFGTLFIDYIKKNRVNRAALARTIGIAKGGMNNYPKRASVQMGIIWKLSIALQHNFLAQIAEQMPIDFETKKEVALKDEIVGLKEQIRNLEIELEVYKRITKAD